MARQLTRDAEGNISNREGSGYLTLTETLGVPLPKTRGEYTVQIASKDRHLSLRDAQKRNMAKIIENMAKSYY